MALQTVAHHILFNLDILGELQNHQTLLVDGERLRIDDRYLQCVRRAISGDSRLQTLGIIAKTLGLYGELLQAYQLALRGQPDEEVLESMQANLARLSGREARVVTGLDKLLTYERYSQDSAFRIEVQQFMAELQKLNRKAKTLQAEMADAALP